MRGKEWKEDLAGNTILEKVLAKSGHVVVSAQSFDAAMTELSQTHFDVAIVDQKLPSGSGLELLTHISELDRSTISILITGFGDFEIACAALRAGARALFSKPLDMRDIVASITELARNSISSLLCTYSPDSTVQRFRRVVEGLTSLDISEADAAHIACLSRSRFSHEFKRVFGVSYREFMKGKRLAMARALIVQDHLRVGDVAKRCGFGSASYFSAWFKREIGMSPLLFRQEYFESSIAHALQAASSSRISSSRRAQVTLSPCLLQDLVAEGRTST